MFGKILKILGIIFLLGVVVIAIWVGFLAHKGNELDKSSSDYVNAAVPAIFNDWNYEELKKRSHPALYSSASEDQIKSFFTAYSQLGRSENFGGCKGDSNIRTDINTAITVISAQYLCSIKFEKDLANITVTLLQDDQKNWKIARIHISTSNFLPEKK